MKKFNFVFIICVSKFNFKIFLYVCQSATSQTFADKEVKLLHKLLLHLHIQIWIKRQNLKNVAFYHSLAAKFTLASPSSFLVLIFVCPSIKIYHKEIKKTPSHRSFSFIFFNKQNLLLIPNLQSVFGIDCLNMEI